MGLKLFREQHYVSRQVEDSVRSTEMKTEVILGLQTQVTMESRSLRLESLN